MPLKCLLHKFHNTPNDLHVKRKRKRKEEKIMSMQDYRINPKNGLEFGLYSLGDHMPDALTGERISAKERVDQIVQ